ncbi:MAG: AraC family transcriptional regulator [Clostridia bacterium]|nr:AraC family transcriptional regulator [Clostridia bacterium]
MIEQDRQKLLPLWVIRTGFKERQYHISRPEGFAAYQVAICTAGQGKFISRGKEHIIASGDIFLFSPRVPHEYYPISGDWQIYFCVFSGDGAEGIFSYFGFEETEVFTSSRQEIREDFIKMCETTEPFGLSLILYKLLGNISRLSRSNPNRTHIEKNRFGKILPVLDYIEQNYKRPVTLDDMADLICVSKSYLCRTFREAYGVTPVNYLLKMRINRAKQLLISTDMKIKLLSNECGFNDTSYFCMIFKRMEGMTPDEFRSLHKD